MLTIEEIRTACERSEPIVLEDPLFSRADLAYREMFYPLGFPLEIETNSEEVLNATAESWRGFVKLFDTPPFKFRIFVHEGRSTECPPKPTSRAQHHLSSFIADDENFAVSDFAQGISTLCLSQAAVAHRGYLRYFFLEGTMLLQIATSYTTPIHAACIDLEGCGVLLCGDSGAGKSTLSYACAHAGWTYITDDSSYLVNSRQDRLVVGNCNQARFRPASRQFFPELGELEITQRGDKGKPSIEICTSAMTDITTSHLSRVNYVVFLNRNHGRRQELIPFPTQVARYSMLQRLFSLPETLRIQSSMIDSLLSSGALELRYTDLEWAVERLGRLAVEGR